MIVLEKQGRRSVKARIVSSLACILIVFGALFVLPGCSGPSKEEQAKQDVQGKQTNDAAMQRMMQEQGKPGAMPGGGAGTPGAGGTGAPVMVPPGGR